MRQYKFLSTTLITLCIGLGLSAQGAPRYLAQSQNPPLVEIQMRRPGYWIAHHPTVDSLILDREGIRRFNEQAFAKGDLQQLLDFPQEITDEELLAEIRRCFQAVRENGNYDHTGMLLTQAFWQDLEAQLNLDEISAQNAVGYGFATRFTNQRLAPYAGIISSRPLDLEFDYLQNSGIDLGNPLIILHESRDAKWLFGVGRASSGWFPSDDIALVEREDWLSFQASEAFIVTTAEKSDLYLDPQRTEYHGLIRMGNRLPLITQHDDCYELLLPGSQKQRAFIAKSDAHPGYLPYTARNVYEQAFKAQNTPYGWGDLNAEYDCSGLIQQLFACFGILLPRNGAEQYKAACSHHEFASNTLPQSREESIRQNAVPAATLLRLPGHIMLYLGSVEGKAYALHSLWGIRRPNPDQEDDVIAVNRTVVTDLSPGLGSRRGSLLARLTGFSLVDLKQEEQ